MNFQTFSNGIQAFTHDKRIEVRFVDGAMVINLTKCCASCVLHAFPRKARAEQGISDINAGLRDFALACKELGLELVIELPANFKPAGVRDCLPCMRYPNLECIRWVLI